MGQTKIEWATHVWNPVTGCTPVSEGCQNCYARRMAYRVRGRFGYPKDNPFKVTLHPERLDEPLRWQRPKRVFVNSMGDLFHEDVPMEFIAEVFNVMACATAECGKRHRHEEECWTGQPHTFLILTKRPERMKQIVEELPDFVGEYWPGDTPLNVSISVGRWPLPNVWLGVTAENQARADERIPILLQIPATVRFISAEPLLGPVDLSEWLKEVRYCERHGQLCEKGISWENNQLVCKYCRRPVDRLRLIDWVIVGGETGPNARPMHPDWVRSLRDQCIEARVPFFFKCWGEWTHKWRPEDEVQLTQLCDGELVAKAKLGGHYRFRRVGRKKAGRLLDGQEWNEFPGQVAP